MGFVSGYDNSPLVRLLHLVRFLESKEKMPINSNVILFLY